MANLKEAFDVLRAETHDVFFEGHAVLCVGIGERKEVALEYTENMNFTIKHKGRDIMNKHTPAPWQYTNTASNNLGGVRSKNGFICFMTKVDRYQGQEERYIEELTEKNENANLIAAAPEMLEALKCIWDSMCSNKYGAPNKEACIKIRDVLLKLKEEK